MSSSNTVKSLLRLLLALLCLCGYASASLAADNLRVLVVLSDNNKLYQGFASAFKQNLPANVQVSVLDKVEDFVSHDQSVDLVLTVGTRAAEWVTGRTKSPLLATMIPRHAYADLLAKRPPAAQTSAIYLDQSWARQADLLRVALPERSRIGLLYSPTTHVDLNELRRQLETRGATLMARQTGSQRSLFDDLEEVLSRSDLLLAVPDGEIYNSNNIRNILLSSYRHGIPLVGFSQAFVNAGALLALFATPEQLAAQASTATMMFAHARRLPEPQFPLLCTVAVNQEVARTLGENVKSGELLRLQIDKLQKVTP